MRKTIIALVILGILVGSGYFGRRAYRAWKWRHSLTQARETIAKGDFSSGSLWLRKTLQANPSSVEAVRMMGDFAELAQSPAAVVWRNRLVELQPGSLTNRLLLARVAVVHREYALAKKALDGVDEAGRKTADFQKTSGAFAVATGQYLEAETNFLAAASMEPQNPIPKLNLAMIQIQRRDLQLAAQARQALEDLRANAAVRLDALRHLTLDAFRHTNYPRALSLAGELARETNAPFSDHLLHLDVLRAAKSSQFQATLASLQQRALTNAPRVYELSRWMLTGTSPADALQWLLSVPPLIQTNLPVTMVVADAYLGSTNWAGLQVWVAKQFWGEMDFVRLAMSARALREQNLTTAAKSEWSRAMKSAGGRLDRLIALQRLTAAWNWSSELEEVLWATVNKFPAEKGAVVNLSQLLYVSGKTRSLLTLYAQEARSDPKNLAVKNNLASIAMLLNASEHEPHELARAVYEGQKDNPSFASTYAYSLFLQKKTADALKIMDQIKPEDLEQPSIAGYYAVMLAASGDKVKARKYLDLAAKARVLPEEAQLFQRVRL